MIDTDEKTKTEVIKNWLKMVDKPLSAKKEDERESERGKKQDKE